MAAFSSYLEGKIVDWLRGTTTTAPTSLKLALYSSDPGDDNSGTEITGGGYARQTITLTAGVSVAGTGTTTTNAGPVVFGPATGSNWVPATHVAVFDQAGNMLLYGQLAAQRVVAVGDTASYATGALSLLVR